MEFIASEHKYLDLDSGSLFNTCREIEGEFLGAIEKISNYKCKKNWAIGPLNPISIKENGSDHECLQWLNMQEENSVILVSFGTTTSFSDDQIKEQARGLEESGVKFIWILREADCGASRKSAVGVVGLEERGIVVRDWAPQLEILGHPATGGFLTHCGWNSCMESISMGKPVAALRSAKERGVDDGGAEGGTTAQGLGPEEGAFELAGYCSGAGDAPEGGGDCCCC